MLFLSPPMVVHSVGASRLLAITAVSAGHKSPLGVGREDKVDVDTSHSSHFHGDSVDVPVVVAPLCDLNEVVSYIKEKEDGVNNY